MTAGARVAAFAGLLVAIFAAAALAGQAIDPGTDAPAEHRPAHVAQAHGTAQGAQAHRPAQGAQTHRPTRRAHADGAADGLATRRSGYRLVVADTRFAAGRTAPLRLRIVDARNTTVRTFDIEQARRMHVVVVRRDLRRYQHLHPEQLADGAWTTALTLPEAGVYRAFADFRIDGSQHVLGVDLFVAGEFAPLELPARRDSASVDGYDVRLHAHGADGLTFAITRGGRPVTDLQPYLGARGHLVALRDGDLAYRHMHPIGAPTNEIAFASGEIGPGVHRLFLQFRHGGRVHTTAFTR